VARIVALWAVAVAILLVPVWTHLVPATELTRLRNAALYDRQSLDARWTPAAVPEDFRVEPGPPLAAFERIVQEHGLRGADDWDTATRIAGHLLAASDRGEEGPIQRDLVATYQRIREAGDGYCGDYARVFAGLANAAGLFVRSWAFSFDGFGGHGHVFSEVWDRSASRWRAIDVFNNYVFPDDDGVPMSAEDVHRLLQSREQLPLAPIDANRRPGYRDPARARAFFEAGADQWYMWWGNDVARYDRSPSLATVRGVSYHASEALGVLSGEHARLRVLASERNVDARVALESIQQQLHASAIGVLGVSAVALVALVGGRGARRASAAGAPKPGADRAD
jgi:hypothetical protein